MVKKIFEFRPWVGKAGWTILAACAAATLGGAALLLVYGWEMLFLREKSLWIYLGTLAAGGARVVAGSRRPVAELDGEGVSLRLLHHFQTKRIRWNQILGIEQTIPGDRLIIHYETARGPRFVAVNLNLIRGRRDFEKAIDDELRSLGLVRADREGTRVLARATA
jgi:hypothetical protein